MSHARSSSNSLPNNFTLRCSGTTVHEYDVVSRAGGYYKVTNNHGFHHFDSFAESLSWIKDHPGESDCYTPACRDGKLSMISADNGSSPTTNGVASEAEQSRANH